MENKDTSAKPTKPLHCTGGICRLSIITPIVKRLNCLDIQNVAETCVTDISELIGAKRASLYILDDSSDILHLEKNNHPFLINNIVSLNQNPPSPMVAAVRSKELMVVNDIDNYSKPRITNTNRAFSKNYKSQSCIIAPLICQNRVVGVLNLTDKLGDGTFTDEDIAVIELFRQLIGASIGNIKLFEKTQRQAKTDGITGMLNHRSFYERLETELRRAQRYGGQISIIMADIDNLKPINDNFGHRAGDMVIRQISKRLNACIRQIDVGARYGGDEFSIILPNTSLSDAIVVAKRMVAMVSETPVMWDENKIELSISVGVGQYDSTTMSPDEVTKATDQAMYAAKQAGKNTVRVVEEAAEPA